MSRSSSRLTRRAVLATVLMAAFVGALGGVVAALLAPPDSEPSPPDAGVHESAGDERGAGEADPYAASEAGEPMERSRPSRRSRRPRRGGQAERDELARKLSSQNPDVAYAAAKSILLAGPGQLRLLSRLRPPTDAGRELVQEMRDALGKLQIQQRGRRYAGLMRDKQLELELAALRSVVPERYLAPERAAYWAAKVESDRTRLEKGTIQKGELLMAEAQRDRARCQLGEILVSDYRKTVDERYDRIRAWVRTAKAEQRFLGAAGEELDRQLAALTDQH